MATIIGTELDDPNLKGTAAADTISGLSGRDHLYGLAGNDTLFGGAGNDAMHGDAGADIMFGGAGNDDYYVDNVNDVVSETTVPGVDDGGNDRVYSTVSYTLSPFLERLVLLESPAAISATGNAIEDALLDHTRMLNGVRVPMPDAELVVFAVRAALKHADLVEILIARRDADKIVDEMMWLRDSSRLDVSTGLCAEWFPELDPALFLNVVASFADRETTTWTRIVLGRRVARALSDRRRYRSVRALFCKMHHVAVLLLGRIRRRRDLVIQTGGMIVALVGPKATGKSTLTSELASVFGHHLDVVRLHVGKPPPTALTWIAHMLVPVARWVCPGETSGAYECSERRSEKRYSLLFVLRAALLAHDRRILLRRAQRNSVSGALVICDRYPAKTVGAIDSSYFDDTAIERCHSHLKRWLMLQERSIYQSLPRPNLVIRLIAPIETAILRDSERAKESWPNADAVRRRWNLEKNGEFATRVVAIETDCPLDETVTAIVKTVWTA